MSMQEDWTGEYRSNNQVDNDEQLTKGEHFAVIALLSFVGIFLVIAVWNAILLANGAVDNGGPLGSIMAHWPVPDSTIALQQSVVDVYNNH